MTGALILSLGCGGADEGEGGSNGWQLEHFDAGFFSIDKPVGWEVATAGACATFAFLIRDQQSPLRQIFYFGTVGPVYLNHEQKDLDAWYVSQGGFPVPWFDAPVVDPFTPENYVTHWPEIADMDAAGNFMPEFPQLDDLGLVATEAQAPMLPGAATGTARGLFALGGAVGEGMFLATVLTYLSYQGLPRGGIGNGHFICGVTAPREEFAEVFDRSHAYQGI